jgi:DinB family protein
MNGYLQSAYAAIETAIEGMSAEQMARHREGKWSTSEILEHLALAFGSTAKVMQKCLECGKPSGTRPKLRDRFVSGVVTGLGYIPEGRKAPKHVVPKGIQAQEAQTLVFENLKLMDQTMQRCEEQFGEKIKIADHPILGPLSLRGWRKFHWVHTRHHMKQIARLRNGGNASVKAVAGARS